MSDSLWYSEEDVETSARRRRGLLVPWHRLARVTQDKYLQDARNDLDVLAPRVAELQRAAKVEALRELAEGWRREHRSQEPIWPQQVLWRADEIERGER